MARKMGGAINSNMLKNGKKAGWISDMDWVMYSIRNERMPHCLKEMKKMNL